MVVKNGAGYYVFFCLEREIRWEERAEDQYDH